MIFAAVRPPCTAKTTIAKGVRGVVAGVNKGVREVSVSANRGTFGGSVVIDGRAWVDAIYTRSTVHCFGVEDQIFDVSVGRFLALSIEYSSH